MTRYTFIALETLSNADHRSELRGDWDSFYAAITDDEPIRAMIDLVEMLSEFTSVVITSGANERHRGVINSWLYDNGVMADDLALRPDGNFDSESELRLDQIEGMCQGKLDKCFLAIEQKVSIAEALRENRLFVMEVG